MGYQFYHTIQGRRELPVVLFLHGFMGSSADFDTAIAPLTNEFRCLLVDLPGHGQTIVDGDDTLYTMQETAHAIVAWLDQLQMPQCFLVGYSMGGRLALYLALHFPQRFPKVVLESASPGLRTADERATRLQHDRYLADQLEADFPAFLASWYNQPLFHALRDHPGFGQVQARRSHNRPAALAQSLRYLSTGLQPSLWEPLQHHTQPLLLLVGEKRSQILCHQSGNGGLLPQGSTANDTRLRSRFSTSKTPLLLPKPCNYFCVTERNASQTDRGSGKKIRMSQADRLSC